MSIAAVLLAAGRSTRFGEDDKLAAPLAGLPLGLHAARAIAPLALAARFVVTGLTALEWPGFEPIANDRPEAGMARSIRLGVAAARKPGAAAILIALADMPFVPTGHFQRLLAGYRGPDSRVASSDGTRLMPPALFGANWFDALERLSGDQGARALLRGSEPVAIDPESLRDIDRPEDLRQAVVNRAQRDAQ